MICITTECVVGILTGVVSVNAALQHFHGQINFAQTGSQFIIYPAKLDSGFQFVSGDQGGRRIQGDNPDTVHDVYSIAEFLSLLHVMGGQDYRFPLSLEVCDDAPHIAPGL